MEILIFHFFGIFHGGHLDIGYLDHVTCHLLRVGHNARERPAAGERPLRTGVAEERI